MSKKSFNELINHFGADSDFRERFLQDPDKLLKDYDLSPQEYNTLKSIISGKSDVCSLCEKPIYGIAKYATLTENEIGSTRTRGKTSFCFHQECYQEGKKKLSIQLARLPSGAATISWDINDKEDFVSGPEDARSGYSFEASFPFLAKIWPFIKLIFILIPPIIGTIILIMWLVKLIKPLF